MTKKGIAERSVSLYLSLTLPQSFDPTTYVSLAFLFGIAAQFRAMDGYTLLRSVVAAFERRLGIVMSVAAVTFLFSPFLLNDVLVLILTPVVIRYARHNSVDPIPLIVAEVTLTNVSSSLTPIGNPQNILLWSASGVTFAGFVAGTWVLVLLSGVLSAAALVPFALRLGRAKEMPTSVVRKGPAVYLALVIAATLSSDFVGVKPFVPLGVAFGLGFLFTYRGLRQVAKEFDLRALVVLYLFISAVSLVSVVVASSVAPAIAPVASGAQPYTGLFMGAVSNLISNVPATQLVLNTAHVSAAVAPKLAVVAGLAGNLGPIASFANLLALQIAGRNGVSVRRTLELQVAIGLVSFVPALL